MPATLHNAEGKSRLVLTCEHASASIPERYGNLGLGVEQLRDHISWDIGAGMLTQELCVLLDAAAVLSDVSRLVVDCNRQTTDHDLIPEESHGIRIPGNVSLSEAERIHRLDSFYHPYHEAIDRSVEGRGVTLLLSIHSFTPSIAGVRRDFDAGVLFDDFEELAICLARGLGDAGLAVRMNEPYSGLDGLIFSARHHGRQNDIPYLEIEINNRLLRSDEDVRLVARRVAASIETVLPR
jgi:predicted N-formylglutamate amidohydrolase